MPTKTDRILSYLPGTFRALPKPTALYSVANAFGNELLLGENSLAALMSAHWVNHADGNAEFIDDLARIAAMYGLAPRPDESVEEFREHLKRYIRTFLEGTVTVQGILRVTAEALGIRIADDYEDMDRWWSRSDDELITVESRGDDAVEMLFGFKEAMAVGSSARPAQAKGKVDLSGGIDLREAHILRLKVDDAGPVEIDLKANAADPASVSPEEIKEAINNATGSTVASDDTRFLSLTSPTEGAAGRLEVHDVEKDAAEKILGLAPLTYHGNEATAALVVGITYPGGSVDLSKERYLRLFIDGTHLAEVDCSGANPSQTTLDEIRDAINSALGIDTASHDNHSLKLTSPTTGLGSSIAFQRPAAQNATVLLFGETLSFYAGQDEQPARIVGKRDLGSGVDLSVRSNIRLRVDGALSNVINCAGADPANTIPAEIVASINSALGINTARHNGRLITVMSSTSGPTSEIILEFPPTSDATEDIFGITPRAFKGSDATAARIIGAPDLSSGIDLMARRYLQVVVDGESTAEIDLRTSADNPRSVSIGELTEAVNNALGTQIASHDGERLSLASPTTGSAGSLEIKPLETILRRRFLTRAMVTDEAIQTIFGFNDKEVSGKPAINAQLKGDVDLSRGVDLSDVQYLRLSIDGRPAVDIYCAGKRPRATLIDEVVANINTRLGRDVATHNGESLILNSLPLPGGVSRIAIEQPQAADALDKLLGIDPGMYRGQDATRVNFVGTVDLSGGINLDADAALKIGLDGAAPVNIALAGTEPAQKTLNQIVIAINVALNGLVAGHDGAHIILTSLKAGADSRLDFEVPDGFDATAAIFGISPPRSYHGKDAVAAVVTAKKDLSGGADLGVTRFLRLAVNGGPALDVDCASGAADPATTRLDEIKEAINSYLEAEVAFHDGKVLTLKSPTTGSAGRIIMEHHKSGDARRKLLGDVEDVVEGQLPSPAIITGKVDLLSPVDLSGRRQIKLAVDSAGPVHIDVSGAAPATTFLDEIVTAINTVFPGLASATEDDRLQLSSPTVGENSHLSLQPLRYLELIEYPPESPKPEDMLPHKVRHGDSWSIINDGAADVFAEVQIRAPHGTVGPSLMNETLKWRVRLLITLNAGETLRLRREAEGGLRADIFSSDGLSSPVSASKILEEPMESRTWEASKGVVLRLLRGRSDWFYTDCVTSRFNDANFNDANFAGGLCVERGIFNLSRYSKTPPEPVHTVFASKKPSTDPAVEVSFQWKPHRQGAFIVNLPEDLPDRFGGKFNEARFGQKKGKPESYDKAVTEPVDDDRYLVKLINDSSSLVEAKVAPFVPLGFKSVSMPFRKPQFLTLGDENASASIYLNEEGIDGFIVLKAKEVGSWGNRISISARQSGPAMYDVAVIYEGGLFENAREVVLGKPLNTLIKDILKPGPVGILQAKAAGVKATVTRNRVIQSVDMRK